MLTVKLEPAVLPIAPPEPAPQSYMYTLFAVKLPPFTKIAPPISLVIAPVKLMSSRVNVPVTMNTRPSLSASIVTVLSSPLMITFPETVKSDST